MRYIIIENSGSAHELGIFSIAQTLKSLDKKVLIFVGEKHFDRTKEINGSYNFKITNLSIYSLVKMRFLGSDVPHLVFNTISTRNCIVNTFLALLYFRKTVFYIRNAKSWVQYDNHILSLKYSFLRAITYLCKQVMLFCRHSLLVEKETIKKFLRRNGLEDVDVIPFIFYEPKERLEKQNVTKMLEIVCPGVVDFKTKNLTLVLDACDLAIASGYNVRLTFLGRPRTPKDSEICNHYKEKLKTQFIYFDGFVHESDFRKSILSSDVIIGAFKINHTCSHFDEVYGTTKGSGVDAHAFSQAKILLVNEGYQVDDFYRHATLYYSTAQSLAGKIALLCKDRSFRAKLSDAANGAAEHYTAKNIFKSIQYLGV